MIVRERWFDSDFMDMGWHDSRLYALVFPDEEFKLKLDIDYIFMWEKSSGSITGFWVSPCDLVFSNVSNFKLEIDFENANLLFIGDISRTNERTTKNGKYTEWDYILECDNGFISFSATGFEQTVRRQPVLSESQDLQNRGQSALLL